MSKVDQIKALRIKRAEEAERKASAKPKKTAKAKAAKKSEPAKSEMIVVRRGRPRVEERDKTLAATKPWRKMNMSRATWYRRQSEQKAAEQAGK